ncbi:ATP-binding cassette domain-containing protein [Erysipelothrix sp. D19-032]
MVVVSHDRLFLDRVCNVVVEIDDYQATRFESNYSGYLKQKEIMIERHNVKYENQQREIERLEKLIEKFRYKRSKAAFAQSKIKYLDRMDKLEKKTESKREFKADFKARLRGGKDVLTANELQVGYDKPLLEFSGIFNRGKRYAIIGDNGTGKSTLLKTISGRMEPLSGEVLLGHQIEMGYFDQQLLEFNMNKTVLEEVWDGFPELDHTEIRTPLGRFLFKGEEVFKSVGVLSWGERVRLALVKLMLKQDNLLILDEPTNHLDIQGKEALEKAPSDYDGTMIFVSHDRYFIEKMATDTYVIKDGAITHTEKKSD